MYLYIIFMIFVVFVFIFLRARVSIVIVKVNYDSCCWQCEWKRLLVPSNNLFLYNFKETTLQTSVSNHLMDFSLFYRRLKAFNDNKLWIVYHVVVQTNKANEIGVKWVIVIILSVENNSVLSSVDWTKCILRPNTKSCFEQRNIILDKLNDLYANGISDSASESGENTLCKRGI